MQNYIPHTQAQQQVTTPEKGLALKEQCVTTEHPSVLDSTTLIKDTATLSEESKIDELARKHSVQTGIPPEFKDEVRIYLFQIAQCFLLLKFWIT